MSYFIRLENDKEGIGFVMDKHIVSLFEATSRACIYKKKNKDAMFLVVNERNGDVEFEV